MKINFKITIIFKNLKIIFNHYGLIGLLKKIVYFTNNYGFIALLKRAVYGKFEATYKPSILDNYLNIDYLPSKILTNYPVNQEIIDIIVPVFKGFKQTSDCLDSVLKSKNHTALRIIVINDASPDEEICHYLDVLRANNKIIYLSNSENRGFIYSVNRCMQLSKVNNVILLNSDTVVSDYWVDRLIYHSQSNLSVGTVTPFSNNATICSFPKLEGVDRNPLGQSIDCVNNAFWRGNKGRSIEIPTAVGFCMFISRACLNDVGLFDQESFGKGYGEENDFCMRASLSGWRHLFALDVYIYHSGEISFANHAKNAKLNASKIIQKRYPDYANQISSYISKMESEPFRIAAAAQLLNQQSSPKILFITHNLGGGTQRHCDELIRFYQDSAHILILKIKNSAGMILSFEIDGVEFNFHVDVEHSLRHLKEFLKSCGVERVHIHHLLGGGNHVMRLVRSLNCPFDLTIHDYYLVCPRANLSLNGRYCGQPDNIDECFKCLSMEPLVESQDIVTWRFNNLWVLQAANRVICPSEDVAKRISKYYSGDNIIVVPHEIIEVGPKKLSLIKASNDKLHLAVIGWLAPHKGLRLVKEAIEVINLEDLPFQITLIGSSLGNLFNTDHYKELGEYDQNELEDIINTVNPHILWLPSTVPETFSYTLSEAMRSGRPIFASNLGAYVERLVNYHSFELFSVEKSARDILHQAMRFYEALYSK